MEYRSRPTRVIGERFHIYAPLKHAHAECEGLVAGPGGARPPSRAAGVAGGTGRAGAAHRAGHAAADRRDRRERGHREGVAGGFGVPVAPHGRPAGEETPQSGCPSAAGSIPAVLSEARRRPPESGLPPPPAERACMLLSYATEDLPTLPVRGRGAFADRRVRSADRRRHGARLQSGATRRGSYGSEQRRCVSVPPVLHRVRGGWLASRRRRHRSGDPPNRHTCRVTSRPPPRDRRPHPLPPERAALSPPDRPRRRNGSARAVY